MKGTTKHLLPTVFVRTVIAIAYACRMLAKFDIGGPAVNHIRTALYLLLLPCGAFPRPAHYPAAGAALPAADGGADAAVAHTADAEIQRCHRPGGGAVHMVSLLSADAVPPAAGVYIALSMGKSEDYRLSRGTGMLSIIPAALFLLVITNDLHQQVFAFKSGVPGLPVSGTYSYRPLILSALAGWWSVWLFPCLPVPEEPYPKW